MARIKTHIGLSEEKIQETKDIITGCDYFSLPDHLGGSLAPGQKFYRRDGTEHTFYDVPFARILKDAESVIGMEAPRDRRSAIYKEVMVGMPGHKKTPEWDRRNQSEQEAQNGIFCLPRSLLIHER